MILDQIVESKQIELAARRKQVPLDLIKQTAACMPPVRDFNGALGGAGVKLIAEVKKASPSKGLICRDFDPLRIARTYTDHGAAAISILTETAFFQGNLDYISQVRATLAGSCPPILRKDFILEPYQVYESRAYGADAFLVSAAILSYHDLCDLLFLGRQLGLACLVEVHNEDEAARAVQAGAEIIGINNRDLHTFEVDLNNTARLRPLIPAGKIVVSESGIRTREDMRQLQQWGVNAALVGEALVASRDIAAALKGLL